MVLKYTSAMFIRKAKCELGKGITMLSDRTEPIDPVGRIFWYPQLLCGFSRENKLDSGCCLI